MTTATLVRNHGYFEGVGRLRLQYRTWEVPSPRAAIALLHGFSDHSGRYEAVGTALAAHGFSTFAMDLRGHGRSDGRRGHVMRFAIYLQEFERFRREIQGLTGSDRRLFLLGHSMGGLIGLRYLQEFGDTFRGAIIVSPWLATALAVPRWKSLMANFLDHVLPAVPVRARLRAQDLCRDPAVVTAFVDDPLVHDTMTPRLFSQASAAMGQVFRRSERLRVPLLFLLAGDDRVVDVARARQFARSLAGDVTTRVIDGAYHELLLESDHEQTLCEVDRWLTERLD